MAPPRLNRPWGNFPELLDSTVCLNVQSGTVAGVKTSLPTRAPAHAAVMIEPARTPRIESVPAFKRVRLHT